MNPQEFDEFVDELFEECLKHIDSKGTEYARSETERFGNFNRVAEKLRLRREQVWLVYFDKHFSAIESYIEHDREFSSEPIRGRIVDAITYLFLLAGMIEERRRPIQ